MQSELDINVCGSKPLRFWCFLLLHIKLTHTSKNLLKHAALVDDTDLREAILGLLLLWATLDGLIVAPVGIY